MATLILRDTYRELEKEMKSLEKLKRETADKIRDAADHGDLKENAEYHAAREEQSLIVYKIQLMQSHAPFKLIENSEIGTDAVEFGTLWPSHCWEKGQRTFYARYTGQRHKVHNYCD